jgi:hypothetical protein
LGAVRSSGDSGSKSPHKACSPNAASATPAIGEHATARLQGTWKAVYPEMSSSNALGVLSCRAWPARRNKTRIRSRNQRTSVRPIRIPHLLLEQITKILSHELLLFESRRRARAEGVHGAAAFLLRSGFAVLVSSAFSRFLAASWASLVSAVAMTERNSFWRFRNSLDFVDH